MLDLSLNIYSLIPAIFGIITACKRSCGKVLFLRVSVILFMGGVVPYPLQRDETPRPPELFWNQTPLLEGTRGQTGVIPLSGPDPWDQTPTPLEGTWNHKNGRYASYWIAFLLYKGKRKGKAHVKWVWTLLIPISRNESCSWWHNDYIDRRSHVADHWE